MKQWVIPPKDNNAFVASMEYVLDFYKRPYDADYPVICMDEPPEQLIEEGRASIPMKAGQDARVDCGYIRHGWSIYSWQMNL